MDTNKPVKQYEVINIHLVYESDAERERRLEEVFGAANRRRLQASRRIRSEAAQLKPKQN